ncbi:hypothetical protein ASG39_03110 [Rhizobium sp. Leaf371]|nr:hypothetical protein ASG39_03110 [Rhizobium sp. Leaf371]
MRPDSIREEHAPSIATDAARAKTAAAGALRFSVLDAERRTARGGQADGIERMPTGWPTAGTQNLIRQSRCYQPRHHP